MRLQVSWVDAIILMMLFMGILRGRARGLSEELLDVLRWLASLMAATYLYMPLGDLLTGHTVMGPLSCYLVMYALVVVAVHISFAILRKQVGDKLVESDAFGNAEYVLGMGAGVLRYACIVLVVLAMFHARYYTPEEIRAQIASQERLFGSAFFPTLGGLQREVFEQSQLGSLVRIHLPVLLIQATAPEDRQLSHAGISRAREEMIDQIFQSR
jgi:uncharacterized membrane protein required for colicin V production